MIGTTTSQGRAARIRSRVRSLPGGWVLWRVGVTIVGVAIIVVGIILLPLPGPGWVVIFAGLGVLATEYEWAARLLRWAKDMLVSWKDWLIRQPRWVQGIVGLAGVIFLAAIALGLWWFLYR
jgi:uncharacterized protein (TIGR02611 family)